MNTRYYMVIIKGEIKTSEIMSCGYNRNTQKWDVKFNNGKTYSYAYLNVEKLTDPEVLNPNMYRISREGREFFDVNAIYVFRSRYESYWHICFGNGSERDYHRSELNIVECVGGSVVKGEDSLQGAIREAKEEVGVDLMPENGQVLFTKTRKIIEGKIFNDIMDVWLFEYEGEVDLGNATTDEVAQVVWMNREQIKELFDANMFVDTLEYFFTEDDRQ